MLRGMILAAGRGTRLNQLTDVVPKPLLPVANRPVMAQGIGCLHRLGIREICVNVSYRADQIMDAFGDGHDEDVRLHWSIEEEPTGTAGGMKRLQSRLCDDRVVLIAGDAMLDVDLTPLLAAHIAHRAFATLATTPVAHPSLYGVVVSEPDGRIDRFQEKPAPGTEISHQANTGIYIFEPGIFDLIPAGEFCDFALHVFPEILRRNLPFYAFPVHGYWTDIGNPGDYLNANMDFLAQRIHAQGCGEWVDGNFIACLAEVDGAQLTNCVIGEGAIIPAGSELTQCVVWPGTTLSEPRQLTNVIFTPHGNFQVDGKKAHALDETAVVVR